MENKIKTVVPTLRFPEFRGTEGWEMVLIGNIGETYGGLTGKNKTDFGNGRSEEHTSELQSRSAFVCRLLLEKKKPP